ncbi:MAG: hypothetical protein A2Y41_06355 [Spirochaetes bacterium GWB1_36_13]|nr:MAG: hypothetical protein A2Y41_06355 [Spirochaetes bacterium GWB1_36_13]
MFINKMGYYHIEYGINNQDFGFEIPGFKCVVDGCSGVKHSEVGAKLFCRKLEKALVSGEGFSYPLIDSIFKDLIDFIGGDSKDLLDYLSFTILLLEERETEFRFFVSGDGILIKESPDHKIMIEDVNHSEYPAYFIYRFIDPEMVSPHLLENSRFQESVFPKTEFKTIGVSTDGLRYLFQLEEEEQAVFKNLLIQRKEFPIKRFINKHHKVFQDDTSFVF